LISEEIDTALLMDPKEQVKFLKDVRIFSEAEPEILEALASVCQEIKVLKGKKIVEKGDPGDAMYILAKGKVRIHDGNHVLARLHAGEVFGEYALIDQERRSASVTAEEPGILLKIDQKDFYQMASGNSRILRGVLKVLISRIREMNTLEEKLSKSYLKISKQKEKIEKQSESIQHQKAQLEQQNFDLTRLNEEKNHLISLMVHQIKNPLTSSLCLAEMLVDQDDTTDKTTTESLQVISKSLKRINNLVTEVLDIDSIESKVYELKYEEINVDEIIQELLDNYNYLIEQKNISLRADVEDVTIKTNKLYFTQIADNLISNAIKATNPGKAIYVNLHNGSGKIKLEVANEGFIEDAEKIEGIFDQYRRQTSMEEQNYPQKGLGLAIVYKYTTAMNGRVWVESKEGGITSFNVELNIK
jgi:signal transduction histidine kinase